MFNIKSKKIIIELDEQEARNLVYHVLHSLKQSILNHYICTHHDSYGRGLEGHAKPLFREQQGKEIRFMKELGNTVDGVLGCNLEKEIWLYLEEEYKKRNNKSN